METNSVDTCVSRRILREERPNLLVATGVAVGKAVDDQEVHLLLVLALKQEAGALVRGLAPRALPAHGRRAASPRAGRRATPRGAATLLSPAAVGASRGPPLSHRPPPPWIGLRHPPTNQHRTPVLTSVHLAWLRQRRRARPPRLFEQQERLVPQSDCAELLFGPCAPRRRCWCPRYCFDRKTYHHSA